MKILHYMFGIPPVRGGGLVIYALDLINAQKNNGDEVILLIPGSINRKKRNATKILKGTRKNIGIEHYIIKNALPIPLASGIKDTEWFTAMGDYKIYNEFLQKLKPDIIHVHSLMGVHANFFIAAKELRIPMVYTTHDYFGLCPTLMLFKGQCNCEVMDWNECWECCRNAYTKTQLILEQSELYYWYRQQHCLINLKDRLIGFASVFRKTRPDKKPNHDVDVEKRDYTTEYSDLKKYYQLIFREITFFHYNSSIAKEQYEKFLPNVRGKVVSITNTAVEDHRKTINFGHTLRIGYLGRIEESKGYYFLQEAINNVYVSGRVNIELNIYTKEKRAWPCFVRVNVPYKYSEIVEVMKNLDVVVVPSLWRETFGFTALEAISCGVPVIVTDFVGAKDLLKNKNWGYLIKADKIELQRLIEHIYDDRGLLRDINTSICNDVFDISMENHRKEMKLLYDLAESCIKG